MAKTQEGRDSLFDGDALREHEGLLDGAQPLRALRGLLQHRPLVHVALLLPNALKRQPCTPRTDANA